MQDRDTLIKLLSDVTDTPDIWADYLLQLKGCELHSTATQECDEEGWHAARTHGIGGSDIAAIMGESKWSSPYDIWIKKTGQELSDGNSTIQSEAARWGNVLEDSVAYEWAARNNKQIVKMPISLRSTERKYMLANIDGFVLSDDRKTVEGVLEIKTTSAYNNDAWEVGPIPFYYICQATWYTMITGLPAFDIVCLVGGQRLYSYHFPKEENLCERMTAAADQFWLVNVAELKEPEATATDLERLQQQEVEVAEDDVPLVDESDETDRLVQAYIQFRDLEGTYKKMKNEIAAKLYQKLNTKQTMLTVGNVVKVTRTSRRSCDMTRLEQEFPEAFEATVTTSMSPRLSIK